MSTYVDLCKDMLCRTQIFFNGYADAIEGGQYMPQTLL